MEGFLDMNYSQNTPHKCHEESVKQTMIGHEIVFKKQVHELHRLYAMQKLLTNCDERFTRWDFLPMKRTFTESHMVESARFILDNPFLQEDQDFHSRIHRTHLDLQLSTSNFCDDDDLGDKEVNLSLSIGRNSNKRSKIAGKSLKNNIFYPPTRDIIDLEESIETGSNENAKPVFSQDQSSRNSINHFTRYPSHGLTESLMNGGDLHQDHVTKDPSCGMTESLMNGDLHHKWSSFNQGFNEWHGAKPVLDLNKDQPNEPSFHSNKPSRPDPSSGGSSCTRTIKPIEPMPKPSSDLTQEKPINIKKEGPDDHTLRKAALSLILISTSIQDSKPKSSSNEIKNEDSNKIKATPRSFSVDSYESLVLKLEESSVDEDCVTSKAFEMNEMGQKDNGIKLKRGRRMKDFQKDVLPMLSSLSKHEIWEDINILEGVIRSREYKRINKVKTGNGEKRFVPVKSKRSRVSYVGSRKKN